MERKKIVIKRIIKILSHKINISLATFHRINEFTTTFTNPSLMKLSLIHRLKRPEDKIRYVVVESEDNKDVIISPIEAFKNHRKLNASYYIYKKLVPSLNHLFRIFGIKVEQWSFNLLYNISNNSVKHCNICGKIIYYAKICENCARGDVNILKQMVKELNEKLEIEVKKCKGCNTGDIPGCMNIYCPVYQTIVEIQESIKNITK